MSLITVKLCVMSFNYIVCDIGQDICPIFFFADLIFLRGSHIPSGILYSFENLIFVACSVLKRKPRRILGMLAFLVYAD